MAVVAHADRVTIPEEETQPRTFSSAPSSLQPTRLRRLRLRQAAEAGPLQLECFGSESQSVLSLSMKDGRAGFEDAASPSTQPAMSHRPIPADSLLPVPRLTQTGRISKAKKGLRGAHICELCGKGYSRAEHLRRHRQNHESAKLACDWPECNKSFSRQDLLDRHVLKHSESRRPSMSSIASNSASMYDTEAVAGSSGADSDPAASIYDDSSRRHSIAHFPANLVDIVISSASSSEAIVTIPELDSSLATAHPLVLLPHQEPIGLVPDHGSILSVSHPGYVAFAQTTSPPPWTTVAQVPTTTGFEPQFLSYPDFTQEANWSQFPSTSESPTPLTSQLYGWAELDQFHFPSSIASSPGSRQGPLTMKMGTQITGNVPYPLPWTGRTDASGSLNLNGCLEEQHLGQYLNLKGKQHYIEAYWKHFHPLFPILHRQTYTAQKTNPLFSAAVMAVGAQYSDVPFAKSDSRLLHEKCRDLITKHKDYFKSSFNLAYMQAIFLVELLSHFKAKRAPPTLSEAFIGVTQQLWIRHNNLHAESVSKSQFDDLLKVPPATPEQELLKQWLLWLDAHSYERLLVACCILESQHTLLIVRPNQPPRLVDGGLNLYLPVPTVLWDSSSPPSWSRRLRNGLCPVTTDVCQTLDEILNGTYRTNLDEFQSLLLSSCHAISQMHCSQNIAPYTAQTHAIFSPQNLGLLESVLSSKPAIQIQHQITKLASFTPFEALLATSGESWVLSQRLCTSALGAKDKFDARKLELRAWADQLQTSTHTPFPMFGHDTALAHLAQSSPAYPSGKAAASHALQCALKIISLAVEVSPELPIFGPEMALYYSSLVLWALTYAAIHPVAPVNIPQIELTTHDHIGAMPAPIAVPPPLPLVTKASPDPALEPTQAQQTVSSFIAQVKDTSTATPMMTLPSEAWRFPVTAVLQWTGWLICGAESNSNVSGVGELIEGAKCVIERLGQRGWEQGWF